MFEKLIVGYVETDEGRDALALAQMLTAATGAQLLAACVLHGPVVEQAHMTKELAQAAAASAGSDSTANPRIIQDRSPSRGLHDLAEREGADAIVLGSTHRGAVGRVLAGSVAERLLTGAPCAVAVAPRGYRNEDIAGLPRVIAVGFDGFPESRRALAQAGGLAQACGATLRVVAVQDPYAPFGYRDRDAEEAHPKQSERQRFERELNDALEELPGSLQAHCTVLPGEAAPVLAREAGKGVDLLVVGSRGYGPLRRVTLGGVSLILTRSSPCPVLVVPRSAAPGLVESTRGARGASAEA